VPKLSVIIPNYNREALIGETLTNLLSQTRPPDELIVVDDGSTDGSADVIAAFGPAVTLLRQANAGPATARNRGFAASSGEFIQFFDSDDLCTPDKLERQLAELQRTEADFAYSPWLQAKLEDGQARYTDPVLQQGALPSPRSPLSWYLRGWVIVFQCCLFRRDLLTRVGPYREDLMPSEDSELLFRMLRAGAVPVHVPGAMVLYRLHANQISLGGIPNEKRTRDWVKFAGIVAADLDTGAAVPVGDRQAWRELQADQALREVNVAPSGEVALNGWERLALRSKQTARRIARRLRGHGWATPYQTGPLTAEQDEQLARIGYRAVLDR
jgi:glycosyltransferase involved in cell wall biosynthesis